MKNVFESLKFVFGIIVSSFLIVAVFLVGWGMSFTSVDLTKAISKDGIVKSTVVQQNTGSKALPGQTDLIVYLTNEENGFWLYRASHNYNDILSKLPKGSLVKIYSSDIINSSSYYTIYQIQTGNAIIYSKDEYNRKEQLAGRLVVLPAAVIMLVILIYQSYKKFAKNRSQSSTAIE